jgi:hypothetical protein
MNFETSIAFLRKPPRPREKPRPCELPPLPPNDCLLLNFPFVNHHWGSGIIFYLVHRTFGFSGLSLLLVVINLAIAGVAIDLIRRYGKWEWGLLSGIIFLPLIVYRAEIRPEIFSSLLWLVFLWVLWRWRQGEIGNKWLVGLIGLQWLWVNLHIYFIFDLMYIAILGIALFCGMRMVVSFGKEEEFSKARQGLFYAALGAIIINLAQQLVNAFSTL